MSDPKFPGVQVEIGGRSFTVPGFSFQQMRKVYSNGSLTKIQAIGAFPTPEELDLVLDVLTDTIRRNHPEVDRAFLEESLSVSDIVPMFRLIFTTSGMVVRDATPGNA